MMNRRAFSLVELMVAMAIIGVLLSLLTPAVMYSREAARRAQCQSHLKQLGVALANFEASHTYYPDGMAVKYDLLPYIDQLNVHRQVTVGPATPWSDLDEFLIPLYRCPSESAPARTPLRIAAANYVGCAGTGVQRDGFNGFFTLGESGPPWPSPEFIRPRDVVDGLSNTVAMSEALHDNRTNHRLRTAWYTPFSMGAAAELDAFAQYCESLPPDPESLGYRGTSRGVPWWDGNLGEGLYNHVLPPNRPSCLNGNGVTGGVYSATSLHSGSVNVLYGDGHLEAVSNSVDRLVWNAMGSRIDRVVDSSFAP